MKCPYCVEEIQPDALKCKYCGEWLDKSKASQSVTASPPDYSTLKVYSVLLLAQDKPPIHRWIRARDPSEVPGIVTSRLGQEYAIDQQEGIRQEAAGKFTCPSCRSQSQRQCPKY